MCRFDKSKTSNHSLLLFSNEPVTITGFSFFLSPGSDVKVDISFGNYSQTENIQNNGPWVADVVPVYFKEPYKYVGYHQATLSLSITGAGGGPIGVNTRDKNDIGWFG